MRHATTLITLENSEEARHERQHDVRFHLHEIYRVEKSTQTEGRLVDSRGTRRSRMEYDCLKGTGFSFVLDP
jgi:hypothetical protein